MPCEWAGMELEPGSRLLATSSTGKEELDFGFVAKFRRGEEANEESMPAKGCIVALRGPEDPKAGDSMHDISSIGAAASGGSGSGGSGLGDTLLVPPAGSSSKEEELAEDRMEVWESDAVCKGCKVSASYKKAWDSLRPRLLDHLADAGCMPGSAVFVTGHSKGAALATLAMFSVQGQSGYHVQLSYNFESPRVGNEAFGRTFDKMFDMPVSLFRITHGADRVPRQPRRELGYRHVGYQVWYKSPDSHDFVVCDNSTLDPHCGSGGFERSATCPLRRSDCKNSTCHDSCKGFAPEGGPHCEHPLAPAKNFCDFAGNSSENWGSEWNEVVKSSHHPFSWEKSCSWGKALPTSPPPPKEEQDDANKADEEAEERAKHQASQVSSTSTRPALPPFGAIFETTKAPHKHEGHDGKEDVDPCFQDEITYQPLDMVDHYFSTESDPWACQTRCAGISACAHWSFFKRGANGDCHVTNSDAHAQKGSVGFIAGPKACKVTKSDRQEYLEFLGGGFKGVQGGAAWFVPGFAAAGALSLYFSCLVGLAAMSWSRPDARSAASSAAVGAFLGSDQEGLPMLSSIGGPEAAMLGGGSPVDGIRCGAGGV